MAALVDVPAPVAVGVVQPALPADRDQILEIAAATGVFNTIELDVVVELLEGYYRGPEESGYHFLSYREDGRVWGFATWGPRPLSEHGYDLYWIATHPSAQRRGVARALMAEVDACIRARGGGWVLIETSSTPPYAAARAFYERCGYQCLAVLDGYYRDGDGLVIYVKRLG
ncbi:MAG TPA: GNAT family N-acetyltransferase [Anaerolineae bacterium]